MDINMSMVAAKDFLNKHAKGVFTVLDQTGAPSSSLMHYAVDDELNFYIGTKKGFGKYLAMKADPRVSFAIIQDSADPLIVVDMQGTAEEVSSEETASLYEWFQSKNTQKHYVKGAEDFVMFRIKPSTLRMADATSGELQISDLIDRQ